MCKPTQDLMTSDAGTLSAAGAAIDFSTVLSLARSLTLCEFGVCDGLMLRVSPPF